MFAVKSMTDATTERSPSYAILGIDSEDRFKNYTDQRNTLALTSGYNVSPYDFQITKNESMMNGFFTRLAVTEVNFPFVIPNINSTTRKMTVLWQVGAGPVQVGLINLPIGFYRPADLAAAVENAVRALDPVNLAAFTIQYAPTNMPNFVYETNAVGVTIGFSPLPANTTTYPYPDTTKQLFNLMGFTTINTNPSIQSAGLATFCQGTRYIDIVCSQLTYNQALKDTMSQTVARDTLCRLYISDGVGASQFFLLPSDPDFAPTGTTPFPIYRQFQNPKFIRWLPNQPVPGALRFEVFDDNGISLADLYGPSIIGRGENWSMTLLVSED